MLPSTSHVTLALLNVRLIVPKLADIEADCELNSANVLCFCEIEQEAVEHRASDRQCKAKWRANETEQATVERRTSNKQRMARKRATDNIAVLLEVVVQDKNNDDAVLCTMCHAREPAFTAKTIFWVDCERCGAWVHSYCAFKNNSVSCRYTRELCSGSQ